VTSLNGACEGEMGQQGRKRGYWKEEREGERWRESTWEEHADKGFRSVALRGESM
jgi:hypothetical protein